MRKWHDDSHRTLGLISGFFFLYAISSSRVGLALIVSLVAFIVPDRLAKINDSMSEFPNIFIAANVPINASPEPACIHYFGPAADTINSTHFDSWY